MPEMTGQRFRTVYETALAAVLAGAIADAATSMRMYRKDGLPMGEVLDLVEATIAARDEYEALLVASGETPRRARDIAMGRLVPIPAEGAPS